MSRIVQMLDSYSYGDGIGNHVSALHNALQNRNVESEIYARYVDVRLRHIGREINEYQPRTDDIILHHLGAGSELNHKVAKYNCRVILNYHNITPPRFFEGYDENAVAVNTAGYQEVEMLADKVECAISDSMYNSSELKNMGYNCPLYSIPIVMNFDDYKTPVDEEVLAKYNGDDGITNIVFIGRIAPNKKHEDIILDFYYYTKYFNPNSRLILVGNYRGFEKYYLKLRKYVKELGLDNVIFTGHIKFSAILAYYQVADLLLCESEHEGFCIPLVEAMYFKKPIVAYNSSAVGETLGTGGILLEKKDPQLVAAVMDQVIRDDALRKKILEQQEVELQRFDPQKAVDAYLDILLA